MALLKCKGFNMVACHGREEALVAPGTMKPDLILPDIIMELTEVGRPPERSRQIR